jgi:membrane protein involved in colicin uptake
MFHLPTIPFLPASLRRRPTADPAPKPEPWPANPRTVADDLRESLANEAERAKQLRETRQQLDIEAARAAAAEQRAERAEGEHKAAAEQLAQAHRELRGLRAANAGLSKQLHDAMYDDADRAAIESGTGQPRKA